MGKSVKQIVQESTKSKLAIVNFKLVATSFIKKG